MTFSVKYAVASLLSLSLATLVWTTSASAQLQTAIAAPAQTDRPDPTDSGWHVDVAPYLWLCSAKSSSFWVLACFSRRHFFQSIFVVQPAQDRTPYHSVTRRNSVT